MADPTDNQSQQRQGRPGPRDGDQKAPPRTSSGDKPAPRKTTSSSTGGGSAKSSDGGSAKSTDGGSAKSSGTSSSSSNGSSSSSTDNGHRDNGHRPAEREGGQGHGPVRRLSSGARAARLAVSRLAELTTKPLEGVVGVRKQGDGWRVEIEVLEMQRIPSTTDVLSVYEVELDASGDLVGYERVARYLRGAGEDHG